MNKSDNFESLKAEYVNAYEMINKAPCPEIVKAKAWIKVGEISFRPDDFERAVNKLKVRCSNESDVRQEVESKLSLDSELLNQAKNSLKQSLDKLNSLNICDGVEIENIKEMLLKCELLVDASKKRNVL